MSAGSSAAKGLAVKSGRFSVGDMKHANEVVRITDLCREKGVVFATSSAFVVAISQVLRVDEFDADLFIHRVTMNPTMMHKRGTYDEYLEEIEAIYNHLARGKRIPLKFLTKSTMRERKDTYGGRYPKKKNTKCASSQSGVL